jgi:hypothetical protein
MNDTSCGTETILLALSRLSEEQNIFSSSRLFLVRHRFPGSRTNGDFTDSVSFSSKTPPEKPLVGPNFGPKSGNYSIRIFSSLISPILSLSVR